MYLYRLDKFGNILSPNGTIIDQAAVCYIPDDELVLKTGEHNICIECMNEYNQKAHPVNLPTAYCINLSGINPEVACYIMNRMINYTLSGFIRNFHDHMNSDLLFPWIQEEMSRVKIDINEE